MCFGYFDLGLASEANAYHRFAILELAAVASIERTMDSPLETSVNVTDAAGSPSSSVSRTSAADGISDSRRIALLTPRIIDHEVR